MARLQLMCVALAFVACEKSPQVPKTSPESEQLRWLDNADVQADFRDHVERQHDTRFISIYALSFSGEFGIADTPETEELTRKHGSRHIYGTTDIITSTEHHRLLYKASDYAQRYNELLLRYLREHPDT